MILSTVVIAGVATAGTLGASAKVYRDALRKRQYPWTVAAERMAKNKPGVAKGHKKLFAAKPSMLKRMTSSIKQAHTSSLAFTQEMIAPFVDETRNQQLAEMTLSDTRGELQMQKEAKRNFYFVLSGASWPWLGLNGAVAMLWCCPGLRMFILGPMSMLNYLHILSRQGILIKDGRSLERLNKIDTVVFDKTGTLTQERPVVSQIFCCDDVSQEQLLTYAAAAEYRQTHPIARAILHTANERQLNVPQIDDTHYEVGYGVKVKLNEEGSIIRVGSQRFMQMCGITIPPEIKQEQVRCQQDGYSLVYVGINEQLAGAIEVVPQIRPEVKEVVQTLSQSGKSLYIISGDHEAPTRRLAQELGIDHYFANILPENTYPAPLGKATLVKELQESGCSVCFIGDGINDAIALIMPFGCKQADVSISLRGATSIATDTAQIVLMDGNLRPLPSIFDLSQEFNHNLDRSFMITTLPEIAIIAGTFLFGWGLLTAVILESFLWLPQLGNVMFPLIKHREP